MGWALLILSILAIGLGLWFLIRPPRGERDSGLMLAIVILMLLACFSGWYAVTSILSNTPRPSPVKSITPVLELDEREPENVTSTAEVYPSYGDDMGDAGTDEEAYNDQLPLIEDAVIYFTTDSYDLVCEARAQLRLVAHFAATHDVISITIKGHADTTGEAERNFRLSFARAETVRRHLVSVLEVDPYLIAPVIPLGETTPAIISDEDDLEQRNRRVELLIEYVPYWDEAYEDIPSVWDTEGTSNCPDSLKVPPPKTCCH